ncbi:MAG: GntR family transcriptional regulator [Spirochaetales bacterium]|nr:GntR family transcriptional regulator [Spirochaetales bacterium]
MYTVHREELSEMVYRSIKEMILTNQLSTGEKIVQEKIASQLGVSRSPLLAALAKLEREMLIQIVPRKGAFVRKLSVKEFVDLYEIRLRLEPLGAYEAAVRRSDKQLKELKKLLTECEKSMNKTHTGGLKKADYKFHMKIMEISENEFLYRMVSVSNMMLMSNLEGLLKTPEKSLKDHKNIFKAIADRKGKNAEQFMYEHILESVNNLKKRENINAKD